MPFFKHFAGASDLLQVAQCNYPGCSLRPCCRSTFSGGNIILAPRPASVISLRKSALCK
jgi:hypothetical protein